MRALKRLAFPASLVYDSMRQAGSDDILILLPSPDRRLRRNGLITNQFSGDRIIVVTTMRMGGRLCRPTAIPRRSRRT